MDNLVSVVNKLQEVITTLETDPIQLPQIVVVGSQSSGKSSVLESLVGQSFLPRGTGAVTRCPLVLQLVQCLKDDPRRTGIRDDWGIFLHDSVKTYKNFAEIRSEIELEMNRRAGCNKGICTEPIVLKIFSDRVSTLTLVDLPGLTKIPVGDQPEDIENTIKSLTLKYISNPNTVIVVVIAANTDIETSEGLQLAREVDPLGVRTLAVITKLDLMDRGTDATDILEGRIIPVKLGVIGVVNRSQRDLNNGVSIKESLINEANFLHQNYKPIASRHGTAYLAKTLQSFLLRYIKSFLPEIRRRLLYYQTKCQEELTALGRDIEDSSHVILDILTVYSNAYISSILGSHMVIGSHDLEGGARIGYIFHETFIRALNHIDPLHGFDRCAILTAMRNASGTKPALFKQEVCFELLVKSQMSKFYEPSQCCIQLIQDELERIIDKCEDKVNRELHRFPKLKMRIKEVIKEMITSRFSITSEFIKNLVQIQMAYINTAHPDFLPETLRVQAAYENIEKNISESSSVLLLTETCDEAAPERKKEENLALNVPRDVLLVESLIVSYFNLVRRTISDTVPKAIMHFMVNYVMDNILSHLIAQIYATGDKNELLEESPLTCNQKIKANKMIQALKKAEQIINEVKDTKA